MAAPSVANSSIDRKPSIDTEPRTLDISQIQFAREAALYVMSTKSIEEAFQIFTEGLEPTVSPAVSEGRQNEAILMEMEGDSDCDEDDLGVCKTDYKSQFGVAKLRDVYTAPF